MAAVDVDAMRKKREEKQRGSDFYAIPEGDTLAYICPPCCDDDNVPFVEVMVNYGLGTGNSMAVTLDQDRNKVLQHARLAAYLAEAGKDVSGGDPVAEYIAAGNAKNEEHAKRIKGQSKYLWNIIPLKHRQTSSSKWSELTPSIQPLMSSYSVWDGIMELFCNEGDITDPNKAILVRINRKGKGQNDTKYTVHPDTDTIRHAMQLSEELQTEIATALAPGGKGDLYKIIAGMTKSRADVVSLLSGVSLAKEDEEDAAATSTRSDAPEGAPTCYGTDCAPADPECQKCPFKEGCATIVGCDVPPDPAAPKKPAPAAAKPAAAAKPPAPAAKAPAPAAKPAAPVPPKAPVSAANKATVALSKPAAAPPKAPAPAAAKPAAAAPKAPPVPPKAPAPAAKPVAKAPVAPPPAPELAEGEIEAGKCEMEAAYQLPDGQVGSFTGLVKGIAYFQTEAGAVKLPAAVGVVPVALEGAESPAVDATETEAVAEEAPAEAPAEEAATEPEMPAEAGTTAEDDAALAEMEAMLAAKKK